MMKKALLVVSTEVGMNIGDYIQGLAARQFVGKPDIYIERERLNVYDGEDCKLIMNGWYMSQPTNWPPSSKIHPLYTSFYISEGSKKNILSKDGIEYLKKHQPIGCRSTDTFELLNANSIESYFSGCLTLTLGETYKNESKEDKVYFVDPHCMISFNKISKIKLIKYLFILVFNLFNIVKLSKRNIRLNRKSKIKRLLDITSFYCEYGKLFTKETLMSAEYIAHEKLIKNNSSQEEYFDEAEELVKKYAKAKFVVTSRIHCALPCLGIETPVLFIKHTEQSNATACRLSGLIDFFNVAEWSNKGSLEFDSSKRDLVRNLKLKNKETWKKYRDSLLQEVQEFVIQ